MRASLPVALLVACLGALGALAQAPNWALVDQTILAGMVNVTPGVVAIVGTKSGIVYAKPFGQLTYGIPPPFDASDPPMTLTTLFDIASLSKVSGGNNAIAQFYQRDTPVAQILGPQYAQNGKGSITVLNLLLHNAGYPPDPVPSYQEICPESQLYYPQLVFTCQQLVYNSLMSQTLMNPVGSTYVYSDLSFITVMYVVGTLARTLGYIGIGDLYPGCYNASLGLGGPNDQCYFEAYVRKYVFGGLGLNSTRFLPPRSVWPLAAPCENDTDYRHIVSQGTVSDGNAYAMGGIAGHAGVFSNAIDLSTMMSRLMWPAANDSFLNSTTLALWLKEYNHSQSSRALGWNTNDPGVPDYGWGLLCGNMSASTWMHTGYTGTMLCGDPVNQFFTVFLTNRVYPNDSTLDGVLTLRRNFSNAVMQVLGLLGGPHKAKPIMHYPPRA